MPLEFFRSASKETTNKLLTDGGVDTDSHEASQAATSSSSSLLIDNQYQVENSDDETLALLTLPPEILLTILSFADRKALFSLRETCHVGKEVFKRAYECYLKRDPKRIHEIEIKSFSMEFNISAAISLLESGFLEHKKIRTPLSQVTLFKSSSEFFEKQLPHDVLLNIPMACFALYGLGQAIDLKSAAEHLKNALVIFELKDRPQKLTGALIVMIRHFLLKSVIDPTQFAELKPYADQFNPVIENNLKYYRKELNQYKSDRLFNPFKMN